MDVIAEALKEQKGYEELNRLWSQWDSELKSYLFLDLAIVHRCKDGVRLMGDVMGAEIYLTPYDEHQRVTPLYIAKILSRKHQDYEELARYMTSRIEAKSAWNRRKVLCWCMNKGKVPELPKNILRYMALEFL